MGRLGVGQGRIGESMVSRGSAVWITGVGAATPLGNTYAAIGDQFLAGRSCIRRVTGFDVSEHP